MTLHDHSDDRPIDERSLPEEEHLDPADAISRLDEDPDKQQNHTDTDTDIDPSAPSHPDDT